MNHSSAQTIYYPQLDGLRFFAFLLVFIHNAEPIINIAWLNTIAQYGWIGVDLFFCLSAFLLTKILLTDKRQTESVNAGKYFSNRALKIVPQYIFFIIIILLFRNYIPSGAVNLGDNVIGLLTFTYNYVYFYLLPSPNLLFIHLWSVSFEVQFYIFFFLFIKFTNKYKLKTQRNLLLTFFLMGLVVRALFIQLQFQHPAIYFFPFTHFDSALGGMALGLGLFEPLKDKLRAGLAFTTGIILNALVLLMPNNDTIGWGLMLTYLLVGLGMTLVAYALTHPTANNASTFLTAKGITYLGKISYGLYLFHPAALFTVNQVAFRHVASLLEKTSAFNAFVFIMALLITICIASITYFFIEKPFLKLKSALTQNAPKV